MNPQFSLKMNRKSLLQTLVIVAMAISGCISIVSARGMLHISNNCNFPVWYRFCGDICGDSAKYNQVASGGHWNVLYLDLQTTVQIALVDASDKTTGPLQEEIPVQQVTVFEGASNDNEIRKVFYELSSKQGNPLAEYGFSLRPSVSVTGLFRQCVPLICQPSEVPCCDEYHPNDVCGGNGQPAYHTQHCPDSADLEMT